MPTTIRRAVSRSSDPDRAVAELRAQLEGATDGGVVFFCAATFDLPRLAQALRRHFDGPIVGCTTAGQIGALGYHTDGIVAVGFAATAARIRIRTIRDLGECQTHAAAIGEVESAALSASGGRAFGLILADGLSFCEERLVAALYQSLGDVPIVGGSAGDDLRFEHTHVFIDGEFVERAAACVVVETTLPFTTFKVEHFEPTSKRIVITGAEPERRCVTSIDGEPAAIAYARHVGVDVAQLDGQVFSTNPFMLRIGSRFYVRAIQRMNPDLSLTLFCAIDEGLVLSIGRCVDIMSSLEHAFAQLGERPTVTIGFDCILRRIELDGAGKLGTVGSFLAQRNVVGFCTYGEQYNGIHVSQTFVGVAVGVADAA